MNEINTKDYAIQFCNMLNELMKKYEYVGDWNWGDPAGQTEPLPTYEVKTEEGEKVWCAIVQWKQDDYHQRWRCADLPQCGGGERDYVVCHAGA